MTTTTETAPEVELTPPCPKCHNSLRVRRAAETGIYGCSGCGTTWEDESIEPDEVLAAGTKMPGTDLEAATNAAVERAADAAQLEDVGLPGAADFKALCIMAVTLAQSEIIPKALQGKPANVLIVLLNARDLGIPATTALTQIHVIDGKPSLSPKLLSARVQRLKMGRIVPAYKSETLVLAAALEFGKTHIDQRCINGSVAALTLGSSAGHWTGDDGDTTQTCRCVGVIGFSSFTWTEAQQPVDKNRLVDPRCQPNAHHEGGCNCKTNWRNYGASRMLWQRVRGYCADDWFPEASLGLYSAEELGAITDDEGEPIDISTVEPVEGFGPPPAAAPPPPATQEQIFDLKARVNSLPEKQRVEFLARWAEKVDEGRLNPLPSLLSTQVAIATALVNGAEANAKADGWKPEAPAERAASRPAEPVHEADASVPDPGQAEAPAAQRPSEPPAPPSGTDAPATPESAQDPQIPPPPEGMAPDLAKQFGHAAPQITVDLVEGAIAIVTKMTAKAVNGALRTREMATDGLEPDRRMALARTMAMEQAEQDWKAANETGATDA